MQAVRIWASRGSVAVWLCDPPPEQESAPLPGAPQRPATPASPSASASRRLTLGPLCAPLRAAQRLCGLREGAPCGVGAWHSGAGRRMCAEGGVTYVLCPWGVVCEGFVIRQRTFRMPSLDEGNPAWLVIVN